MRGLLLESRNGFARATIGVGCQRVATAYFEPRKTKQVTEVQISAKEAEVRGENARWWLTAIEHNLLRRVVLRS